MPESGELSESDMENVAGGVTILPALAIGGGILIAKAIKKAFKR